jgi:hypothetical protein
MNTADRFDWAVSRLTRDLSPKLGAAVTNAEPAEQSAAQRRVCGVGPSCGSSRVRPGDSNNHAAAIGDNNLVPAGNGSGNIATTHGTNQLNSSNETHQPSLAGVFSDD